MSSYQPRGKIRDVNICRICKVKTHPSQLIIDKVDGNNFALMKHYAENPICIKCLYKANKESEDFNNLR